MLLRPEMYLGKLKVNKTGFLVCIAHSEAPDLSYALLCYVSLKTRCFTKKSIFVFRLTAESWMSFLVSSPRDS
jgi:hypothetical protein